MATAVAVVSGTAGLATLTAMTTSAQADPSFVSAYAGVGADVTQDVYAGLSGASPAPPASTTHFYLPLASSGATNSKTIDSFDAAPAGGTTLNPGCITTKLGGPSFDRPNSTTAGIAALLAAVNGTGWQNSSASCTGAAVNVTGQIDFARAARGPKSSGTTLTFVPFARDALGVLEFDHGTGHLATLTTAQLTALYSSSTGTSTINGDTVYACLTISGSTPRSNLESAIGVSDSTANTAANAAGCNNIQQNSGDNFYTFASTLPSGSDAVIPISSGSWIGQANGVGVDRSSSARAGGVDLAVHRRTGQALHGHGTLRGPQHDLLPVVPVRLQRLHRPPDGEDHRLHQGRRPGQPLRRQLGLAVQQHRAGDREHLRVRQPGVRRGHLRIDDHDR